MSKPVDCEILGNVLDLFADSVVTIRKVYAEDECFRELCGDYAECKAILDRFYREQVATDVRIEQYTELRASLEQELQWRIAESAVEKPEMGG